MVLPLSTRSDFHRTCLTPQTLGTLAKHGVERIAGFSSLLAEDQARVRLALQTRRVDLANADDKHPSSSQPVSQPTQQTADPVLTTNKKKRKAETVPDVLQSQKVVAPSPTQASARRAIIGGTVWEEGAEPDEVVELQVDELFCTLPCKVVGLQYYKGGFLRSIIIYFRPGSKASQGLLTSESKFASSENHSTGMIGKSRTEFYRNVCLTYGGQKCYCSAKYRSDATRPHSSGYG